MKAKEGDSKEAKISYLHHWIDSEGMSKVESWMNREILFKQEDFDQLEGDEARKRKIFSR